MKAKIKDKMFYSETGTHWLAGKTVEVFEVEAGEIWEEVIVEVGVGAIAGNSKGVLRCWINEKDIERYF